MKINSVSINNRPQQQNEMTIHRYNKNLLKLQRKINSQPEMDTDTRRKINYELQKSAEEIIDTYNKNVNKGIKTDSVIMKKLQLLNIKYTITAIKCGDTDWDTFHKSELLYKNINHFIDSPQCTLTQDEQRTQHIDSSLRNSVWLSCVYNFSRELVYQDIDAPQDKENTLFYNAFTVLKKTIKDKNIARIIANSQAALQLCEYSFHEEPESKDELYYNLKEVVTFYDDYLQALGEKNVVPFLIENAYFKKEQTLIPENLKRAIAIDYYDKITQYL